MILVILVLQFRQKAYNAREGIETMMSGRMKS